MNIYAYVEFTYKMHRIMNSRCSMLSFVRIYVYVCIYVYMYEYMCIYVYHMNV